jgi:ACT domain-containing protein
MKKENTTKANLLNAFDLSKNKQVAEACRIAGVSVSTYFFHFYKDEIFRRSVLEKQRDHLSDRIAAV